MRRKSSYIKKYGQKAGAYIFKLLQKIAAQARWKALYREKVQLLRRQLRQNNIKPCA
jgi:hypothetical protein